MSASVVRHQYINALRGYAILIVLIVHTLILTQGVAPALWTQLGRGGYGVQLFFVVSAIALAQSWHERGDGVWPFYIRRIFRIAPMFWIAIIAFHFLPWPWGDIWNHQNVTAAHMLLTAFFAHGAHPLTFNQVVPGGWTIAVEMGFYVLFPLIMAAATTLRRTLVLLIASLLVSYASTQLALVVFADSGAAAPAVFYFATRWLPAQLPVFIFGVATYQLIKTNFAPAGSRTAQWILVIGLGVFSVLPYLQLPQTLTSSVYAAVFSTIALGLARGSGRWLVNPAICWLGTISFSAYLWHFAVLSLAAPAVAWFPGTLPFLGWILLVLAITVMASTVTYLMIEEPMIRFGSRSARWVKAREPRTEASLVAEGDAFEAAGTVKTKGDKR